MLKSLLAATALTAVSATAFAADLPKRNVAPTGPAPIFTWTGFYVGGTVGAVNHNADTTSFIEDLDYDGALGNGNRKVSNIGVIGGVTAGYNYQMGKTVLGLEADYSLSSASAKHRYLAYVCCSGDVSNEVANAEQKSALKALGTVRARVGYAADRTLFFVTGGLAYGQVRSGQYDGYPYGPGDRQIYDTTKWRAGWVAGAGVEHALSNNITVKLEGLYYDLGRKTGFSTGDGYASYTDDAKGLIARIGVNYKF